MCIRDRAKQVNSKGEVYEHIYGLTTSQRVYGTVKENQLGHGPCYLKTSGITSEQDQDCLLYTSTTRRSPN